MIMKKIYKEIKKDNLIYGRTSVYNINYHIVWTVKDRKRILTPEIETQLKLICKQLGDEHGFKVQIMEVGNQYHVHCFVSVPPKLSISKIVKILKGTSARLLFIQFPELKSKLYKNTLWNPSYYVETIGCISESVVKNILKINQNRKVVIG